MSNNNIPFAFGGSWCIWLDNIFTSAWAMFYCYSVKDIEEVRNYITVYGHALIYCSEVGFDDERLKKIVENEELNNYIY